MSVFSRLRAAVAPVSSLLARRTAQQQTVRLSHDRVMDIKPSTYRYKLFYNDVHFYLCLTGLPVLALIVGVNVFIGPATLTDTPEGYEPEFHEYHRHPITRFFVKYLFTSEQLLYERTMHAAQIVYNIEEVKKLKKKVKLMVAQRGDYQEWAYRNPHRELMTRVFIRDTEEQETSGHPHM